MNTLFLLTLIATATLPAHATASSTAAAPGTQYSADQMIQHEKTHTVELIGNAKITQGTQTVTGDKIIFNHKTGAAKVDGNARYAADSMTVALPKTAAGRH